MPKQIPDLPASSPLDGDELAAFRDAIGDVKVTADQIADYIISRMTPAEILAKVIAANPESNGLNSQFLGGASGSFFRDASNLNAGTVPDARLPSGEYNTTWTSGGAYPNAGSLKCVIKHPENHFGQRIMEQFGWTNFVSPNQDVSVTFYEPFVGGWGTENKPMITLTPECRGSEWSGSTSSFAGPGANVELQMALWYSDLSSFKCSPIRIAGSGTDKVRANWRAIGFY